jgi:hypothetical protein
LKLKKLATGLLLLAPQEETNSFASESCSSEVEDYKSAKGLNL